MTTDAREHPDGGRYQRYQWGWGGSPSGYGIHAQLDGSQPQRVNVPQFANADYDAAMANFLRAGDEAGQVAAARAMDDGRRTTTPILPVSFTLESDYVPPWVKGFRPNVFTSCWNYLDVDRPVRR